MKNAWFRKAVVVLILTAMGFAAGCFETNVDGKYRGPEGVVRLELKDGKVAMDVGQIHIDGKYTVDGDKLTIKPVAGPNPDVVVLTIQKDGSLKADRPNELFDRLIKVK
jgi:hypothetical protein